MSIYARLSVTAQISKSTQTGTPSREGVGFSQLFVKNSFCFCKKTRIKRLNLCALSCVRVIKDRLSNWLCAHPICFIGRSCRLLIHTVLLQSFYINISGDLPLVNFTTRRAWKIKVRQSYILGIIYISHYKLSRPPILSLREASGRLSNFILTKLKTSYWKNNLYLVKNIVNSCQSFL